MKKILKLFVLFDREKLNKPLVYSYYDYWLPSKQLHYL